MLPILSADKANHALYGAGIFAAAYVLLTLQALPALPLAAAAVVVAAVGKELYDRAHRAKHTPDIMDALATLAGGALVALPLLV